MDAGHAVVGVPAHVRAVGDIARRWSPRHGWVGGRPLGRRPARARRPAGGGRCSARRRDAADGADGVEDPAPYVFSTQLGHELTLYGQPGAGDELVLRGDPDAGAGWGALWFAGRRSPRDRARDRRGGTSA